MTSFIMVARNDEYCNKNDDVIVSGIEDYNTERLRTTLKGIEYLEIPEYEVIIVECFPVEGRPTYKEMFNSDKVRVITINNHIRDIFYTQVPYKLPVYEFFGKHIGRLFAKYEDLFFMNNDDIYNKKGIQKALFTVATGNIIRAIRWNLYEDIVKDYDKLKEIINCDTNKYKVGEYYSENAGGDYFLINKKTYDYIGGFRLCHGEWDLDREILNRADALGIKTIQKDFHYHIPHYRSKDQHCMTPNRPPRIPGNQHPLITDVNKIIDMIIKDNK